MKIRIYNFYLLLFCIPLCAAESESVIARTVTVVQKSYTCSCYSRCFSRCLARLCSNWIATPVETIPSQVQTADEKIDVHIVPGQENNSDVHIRSRSSSTVERQVRTASPTVVDGEKKQHKLRRGTSQDDLPGLGRS